MKKLNTSPISGMQELLPSEQAVFNNIKQQITEVFHSHGFQEIETPIIDRTEILLAKAGGDTEKQIYKVVKTAETAEAADQALRFDHTVPLARYVVQHESALSFPFRVAQIGRNFRGERAQKGRYREFYQLDIDVIGRETLPLAYDADTITTLYHALKTFLKPKITIRISNRKILSGLLKALNLDEKAPAIFSIVDHAEKVPPEKTQKALKEENLTEEEVAKITKFMHIRGSREQVIKELLDLKALNIENAEFSEGIKELESILRSLESSGLADDVIGDMLIVRGLDYYTGTVFETFLPDYPAIGSVCSGGRYENLAGNYTDQKFPGVGGSIGLTRLFCILNEQKILSASAERNPIDIALIPISEKEQVFALSLADKLRASGKTVDVVLTDRRLGDKMKYAARIANSGIVIGESEVATGDLKIKDFTTGKTSPFEA